MYLFIHPSIHPYVFLSLVPKSHPHLAYRYPKEEEAPCISKDKKIETRALQSIDSSPT